MLQGGRESYLGRPRLTADAQRGAVLAPGPGSQVRELELVAGGGGGATLDGEPGELSEAQHLVGVPVTKRVTAFDQRADDRGRGIDPPRFHCPDPCALFQSLELGEDLLDRDFRRDLLGSQECRDRLLGRAEGAAVVVGCRCRGHRAPGDLHRGLEQASDALPAPTHGIQVLLAYGAPAQQMAQHQIDAHRDEEHEGQVGVVTQMPELVGGEAEHVSPHERGPEGLGDPAAKDERRPGGEDG